MFLPSQKTKDDYLKHGNDFEVGNKEETSRFSVVLCWKIATTTSSFSSLEHINILSKRTTIWDTASIALLSPKGLSPPHRTAFLLMKMSVCQKLGWPDSLPKR